MKSQTTQFEYLNVRKRLAHRLGLPFEANMQDWEWEVADSDRFYDFLREFKEGSWSIEERILLMEILLQCAEDMDNQDALILAWKEIEVSLKSDVVIYRSVIDYWSCLREQELERCFRLTPFMRELLL